MDTVVALQGWIGSEVLVSINDGETQWHLASFHGELFGVDCADERADLAFTDDRTRLILYGDLVDRAVVGPDNIDLQYRGGDISIQRL